MLRLRRAAPLLAGLLGLPSLALAQVAPGLSPLAPTNAANEGWQLLDGVAVQAGDRVITFQELEAMRRREMESRQITNQTERDLLLWNLIEVRASQKLEPQAGEDLGFDPEMIRQHVRYTLAEQRRDEGAIAFSERLESSGQSLELYETTSQDEQYRDLWQRSMMGYPTIPGERPTRDRFVRPGELRGIYHRFRDQLNPPMVQLQAIVSPAAAWGGVEAAREGLEAVRARALAGEDFGQLEREFNAEGREELGMIPMLPASQIQLQGLREFAIDAEEGAIGPLIELEREGQLYFLLARVVTRKAPDDDFFGRAEVQKDLRQRIDQNRDNGILGSERMRLMQRSYSWVHPALGHLQETAQEVRAAQSGRPPQGP